MDVGHRSGRDGSGEEGSADGSGEGSPDGGLVGDGVPGADGSSDRAFRLLGLSADVFSVAMAILREATGRWDGVPSRPGGSGDARWNGGRREEWEPPDGSEPDPSELPASVAGRITPRQREVLGWVRRGYRLPRVAEEMGLGVETVKAHYDDLKGRLGCRTRDELMELLDREGRTSA